MDGLGTPIYDPEQVGGRTLSSGQSWGTIRGSNSDPWFPLKNTERQEAGEGARVQQLDQQRDFRGQSALIWIWEGAEAAGESRQMFVKACACA